MSKTYRPYDPDQQLLLPTALQEWLPDGHLAYFIYDVVDQLDLSEITDRYERERRGGPPYHPRMMVKVLLYGYCAGVASSRRIAQRLHEDIAFRVLAANNTPDFRTISDFRKGNPDALSGLFLQILALCQQAGLVKRGATWRWTGRQGESQQIQALGDDIRREDWTAIGLTRRAGAAVHVPGPEGKGRRLARYDSRWRAGVSGQTGEAYPCVHHRRRVRGPGHRLHTQDALSHTGATRSQRAGVPLLRAHRRGL